MSSDGYFDDDSLDDAAFQQLDAIEAAHLSPGKQGASSTAQNNRLKSSVAAERSFYDLTFDIDESELERLDVFIEDAYQGKVQPGGPSKPSTSSSRNTVQTTLFGDIAQLQPAGRSRSEIQRSRSAQSIPFGKQPRKTKQWDHTAFAKSGLKRGKSKDKGKQKRAYGDGDSDGEEEEIEFEQFPAPFISLGPPPPMKVAADLLEAKHWIYPTNQPKRDYQFNIVKRCLFDNTIVALPTGLGKTFIAGVLMLNYYRWFPEGKVVFVAPTKPLVAQQIEACHRTCGIPGSDAAELTGQIPKATRAVHWKQKRVFYMTPQTFINDLMSETCDARDIVLLVVDEAHRATGDYAYNQVVRYLMAKNPHFRILALTATPGGNPDAVQCLIDGLHISRIEIRDENSLDLKPYLYEKKIEQHIVSMTEDINIIKEALINLMESIMKPLRQKGVLGNWDRPEKLHPFRTQMLTMEAPKKNQSWACSSLVKLTPLARAMGYLLEATTSMCYNFVKDISLEMDDNAIAARGGKKGPVDKNKKLRSDPLFLTLMKELEVQRCRGFSIHPKMDCLKTLIVQHFGQKLGDEDDGREETKAMVFVTFREAVDEIVEALNFERPLIRAHKFIGQGTDKAGNKGLAQKEQLEIINKFKAGEYNVLVATSIGEEGLDIGEVDLIVCYDAQKTPIRMLQRSGRTGRKRAGIVHILLAEGREEMNFDKAKDAYKQVQKSIVSGEQLELYDDVKRLLPEHIKPECLEKRMEIQEYVRDEGRKKQTSEARGSFAKGTKRKRNDDMGRNIPSGASTGFVSVADLILKNSKKRKKVSAPRDFDVAGLDDEADAEIESGEILVPPRRTQSVSATSQKSSSKAKLRKASSLAVSTAAKRQNRKKRITQLTSSQLSMKGADDSDDMEIEQGIIPESPDQSSSPRHVPFQKRSGGNSIADQFIEISEPESRCHSKTPPPRQSPSPFGSPSHQDISWLVDDDEEPDIEILDSSPVAPFRPLLHSSGLQDESVEITMPTKSYMPVEEVDESVEFVESNARPLSPEESARTLSSPLKETSAFQISMYADSSPSRKDTNYEGATANMPPPQLPRSSLATSPKEEIDIPEPSLPVRRAGKGRRRLLITDELDSPSLEMPPPSRRRLHRLAQSTPAAKRSRTKPSALSREPNPFFDFAAAHSGDEVSEGHSSSDDEESESDKQFIKDSPLTQASPSYNQTLAYRQSLLTQAPTNGAVPAFSTRPLRRGAFGRVQNMPRRHGFLPSSSPPLPDDELDGYVVGSFVVEDDVDMSFVNDSTEL